MLFNTQQISFFGEFQPIGGLELGIWGRVGEQVDYANTRLGEQVRVAPFLDWNVNRNLLLKLRHSSVKLDAKDGPNIFDASVYDVRLTWQFSVRSFLRVTTQWQDVERNTQMYVDAVDSRSKKMGRQLLYSYKVNPQTVFFLGYSDRLIADDDVDDLTAAERSWFMKVGYAWNL